MFQELKKNGVKKIKTLNAFFSKLLFSPWLT